MLWTIKLKGKYYQSADSKAVHYLKFVRKYNEVLFINRVGTELPVGDCRHYQLDGVDYIAYRSESVAWRLDKKISVNILKEVRRV